MAIVYEDKPDGVDIATLMGRAGDTDTVALASAYVDVIWEMAKEYTRGVGFTDETAPAPMAATGLVSVVKLAAVRIVSNPTQVKRYQVGEYSEVPATFDGFTLAELAVLNRYRRMSA